MSTDERNTPMTTDDQRNAALEFFGLPKEPAPEVARAADGQAARVPDPVQTAHANGENTGLGGSNADRDARDFFGLGGGSFSWSRFVPES